MQSWPAHPLRRIAVPPSLADVQTRIRDAVVLGAGAGLAELLIGGDDPMRRLAVHRRHYEASLIEAVLRQFPGVVWLVGEAFTSAAAKDFVRRHPPIAPCIADYAETFPDFLARRPGAERVPYIRWFAALERCLGQVALAVDEPALRIEDLSGLEPHTLIHLVLSPQPGLRYHQAPWPVDRLIALFLDEAAPDEIPLETAPVYLQVFGARGRFRIDRLDAASFAFRAAVTAGLTLEAAAERAIAADPSFDLGRGLACFLADGLVARRALMAEGARS
jgi:hypothetical protein